MGFSVCFTFPCLGAFLSWSQRVLFPGFSQCGESWVVFFLCLGRHVSWIFSFAGRVGWFSLCKESVISLLPCHLATLKGCPSSVSAKASACWYSSCLVGAVDAAISSTGSNSVGWNSKNSLTLCARVIARCSCSSLNQASDRLFLLAACAQSNHA